MNKNIILCGVGGQGTILASRLIATAAMDKDIPIKTAETIGMAQRGGSVFSHLRLGKGTNSPLIGRGEVDLIIGFEPGETVRQLPFLKKGGTVVVSSRPVMPVSAMIGQSSYDAPQMIEYLKANVENLVIVDADKAAEDLGSAKTLNVVLLGAALRSGELGLSEEDLIGAIRERFRRNSLI
jgi:indolepyruvate ferredoxin oxidoreductase beta subunit